MTAWLAGLLAGVAVALALRGDARARMGVVLDRGARPWVATSSGAASMGAPSPPGPRPLSVAVASASAGLGVAVLAGGWVGPLLGAAAAAVAFGVLRRLEPRSVRERRERLAVDLPTAVDLIGACLLAGRPPTEALPAVAAAVGPPVAEELSAVTIRLRLGGDPVRVWREVAAHDGPLAALGRTMARATETGAPMADGLALLAGDLRRRRRAAAEQRARSVGVRAAAPLGLCFLPAFVLIGIVPSVVSAFAAMSWW